MLRMVAGACALVLIATNGVMAQTPNITPIRPPVNARLICADPAIQSLTITKGERPGQMQFSFEVVNAGAGPWAYAIYSNVELIVISSNGRNLPSVRYTQRLPYNAAAGARIISFTSPMIDNAFDTSDDFAGASIELAITLGAPVARLPLPTMCPNHTANDRLVISHADGRAFMEGSERTRTWRP